MITQLCETSILYPSPVGCLRLKRDGDSLTELSFVGEPIDSNALTESNEKTSSKNEDEHFAELTDQLDEYFEGSREKFELTSLVIRLDGTAFQKRVWQALCRIPYGETISYGELAKRIGNPSASRAVGLANGRNPISILIPCHRVIGANGRLVGYGGGLERKRMLLEIESTTR